MAFRVNVSDNWDARRCDPYVVPIAGFFKPVGDRRSAGEFASDNWRFCQKEYIQSALRTATTNVRGLVSKQTGSAGILQDVASVSADMFFDLWKFCHDIYAGFMDRMKTAAALFRNFMIQLHTIVSRLDASVTSIVFGLISLIVGLINSIHVAVIATAIVVGILLVLQIILFLLIWPISGLLASVAIMVDVGAISLAAAVAQSLGGEMFVSSGSACFTKDVLIVCETSTIPIDTVCIGMELKGGSRVTAVHRFRVQTPIYSLHGVHVTGDHLVYTDVETGLIPVCDHQDAMLLADGGGGGGGSGNDVWCLTTSNRQIPAFSSDGTIWFADWEEIQSNDLAGLHLWYKNVWKELNGFYPADVTDRVVCAESGLSQDCQIAIPAILPFWNGGVKFKSLHNVRIGDRVFCNEACTEITRVIGIVEMEGTMNDDAVTVSAEGETIRSGTWIHHNGLWITPAVSAGLANADTDTDTDNNGHRSRWLHLYTAAGTFVVKGGSGKILVRDASDVGLESLKKVAEID